VPVSATKPKHIHLQFIGMQQCLNGFVPMFNILEPLPKHSKGSTLSGFTLHDEGVFVPDVAEYGMGEIYCPVEHELDAEIAAFGVQ